jgi:hypothetical protein
MAGTPTQRHAHEEREMLVNVLFGAWLIALALPRGPVREFYAGWDRYIV